MPVMEWMTPPAPYCLSQIDDFFPHPLERSNSAPPWHQDSPIQRRKAEMCTTLIRLYEVISNNSSPAIRFITSRTKTVDLLKTTSMNRRNDYSNKTLLKCTYTMLSGNICRSLQLLEKLHLISHPHHSLKQICLQVKEEQTQHTLLLYSLQTPSTGTYPESCSCYARPSTSPSPPSFHRIIIKSYQQCLDSMFIYLTAAQG
ncbi:uncharacterized protein LOC121889199 isoform X3 [Thunnus maccoyii]|uniref:uncharacterized protein LOC121889199 isoform X3 n=1 Tax=Thunnus maccoyii TaxID=8240 RepID=UPI001C4BFC4D|nr:uncharacterized protein LOC121889199 isoform X3 [Thunnus maccoyii]